MKNRTILGTICVLLAAAAVFGVSPVINSVTAEKTTVCQVNKDIEQGQVITDADVVKVQIGSFGVKSGVIEDESQLVGKFAKSDIYPNVNLYPEMLSDKADSAEDVFKTLDGTHLAISVTIPSFADGLSGKLRNGDIISVIAVNGNGSSIPAQLTYVKVITATTSKGADADTASSKKNNSNDMPATVTLLVNSEQAKILAGYNQNAKLHLALVYRGSDENAAKFLAAQDKIFTESEEKPNE